MNAQSCWVQFDAKTGKVVNFCFGPELNDPEDRKRVVERRVEQITKQLNSPHGLTNRERRQLDKERTAWQKAFLQTNKVDPATEAKEQKKFKAAEKKLKRLVRKANREQRH
jgi:hypothetical protein